MELDTSNPVWYETLGIRLRLLRKQSYNKGLRYGPPGVEESTCFATAYNLRPDVPRFFASLSRHIAEMLKIKRYTSGDRALEVNVQHQSIETVEDALNFLKNYTR